VLIHERFSAEELCALRRACLDQSTVVSFDPRFRPESAGHSQLPDFSTGDLVVRPWLLFFWPSTCGGVRSFPWFRLQIALSLMEAWMVARTCVTNICWVILRCRHQVMFMGMIGTCTFYHQHRLA
jgi:hypothetical protein